MLEVLLFCDKWEIRGLNEDISANFCGEENEAFWAVYFFENMPKKTLNQISYPWLFSSSNLKVSFIVTP